MTHNLEIELPKTVKEVIAMDEKNRHTYWQDAITKKDEKCEGCTPHFMVRKHLIVTNFLTVIWCLALK